MNNKLITMDALSEFKDKQDTQNALTYLTRIVYPTLPTDNNYVGRMAFQASDERLYLYTSAGWKKIPWADEILWTNDSEGNIIVK